MGNIYKKIQSHSPWPGCVRWKVSVKPLAFDSANNLVPSPPYSSRNCGGCWRCWNLLGTSRTAGDHLGKLAPGCCPLPVPSFDRSWSFHIGRDPRCLQASDRRWWCRCWGPVWWEGTCQESSYAGRDLRGSCLMARAIRSDVQTDGDDTTVRPWARAWISNS